MSAVAAFRTEVCGKPASTEAEVIQLQFGTRAVLRHDGKKKDFEPATIFCRVFVLMPTL